MIDLVSRRNRAPTGIDVSRVTEPEKDLHLACIAVIVLVVRIPRKEIQSITAILAHLDRLLGIDDPFRG